MLCENNICEHTFKTVSALWVLGVKLKHIMDCRCANIGPLDLDVGCRNAWVEQMEEMMGD